MGDAPIDIGSMYRASRERLTDMIRGAGPQCAEQPVAACPGWTVADVVAHLLGVVEDAAAGRLTGPPPPDQTAEQVERHRGQPVGALLDRWAAMAPAFEAAITSRQAVPAFLDVLSHEHDISAAVGQPADRHQPCVHLAAARLASVPDVPVRIEIIDAPTTASARSAARASSPEWTLRAAAFEVFRLRLGRRSRQQVRALDWSADPTPILDRLFVFGPAEHDIDH